MKLSSHEVVFIFPPTEFLATLVTSSVMNVSKYSGNAFIVYSIAQSGSVGIQGSFVMRHSVDGTSWALLTGANKNFTGPASGSFKIGEINDQRHYFRAEISTDTGVGYVSAALIARTP